ncbi:hypothetical protein BDW02DRAFT_651107 [Decorospora gaudefroyi]|uniref:Uncharacterized protein n=1 Tax=Decorospora gaudefroyi TaxID=184978 RepID=A0A6A5K4X0_9PLEO|nr:hypothetical protein BDW02DRAFT_651107 [Decorospora gaudefroyi]
MLSFHALIALLLATLTLSCPPPYNDMRLIGNTTHTSYNLIQAASLDPSLDYKCENVAGYDEAKARVEAAGTHSMEENLWDNDEKAEKVTRKGPFDANSTMLYHSYQGVGKSKDYNKYTDVLLMKWRNTGHNTHPEGRTADNCFKYRPLEDISDGDFDAIKDLYPWTG